MLSDKKYWFGIVVACAAYACSGSEDSGPGSSSGGTTSAGRPALPSSAGTSGGGRGGSSLENDAGKSASAGAAQAGTLGGAGKAGTLGGAPGSAGASAGGASAGSPSASGGANSSAGGPGAGGGAGGGQAGAAPNGGSGGGATSACDPALSATNREIASKALNQLFVQKDIKAVDAYWAEPYLQHNPIAKSGVSAFRSIMGQIVSGSGFTYTPLLTLAECDLAVVLGRYSQTGVIFDMFRLKDGKIMEHWDSDSNQASEVTGIGALGQGPSAENRALFLSFAEQVLVGGEVEAASEFLAPDYVEHHGTRATGPSALGAYLSSENVTYTKVHHVIADGNFVFALSEGKRGASSFGFYDLFEVTDGKLSEHWDSRRPVPSSTASGLPIF